MAPPAGVGDCPYRVLVSGLKRGPVKRHRSGIVEEDDLGYLFYNRGCNVDGVRLVVDPRTDRSRGFGFVDFEDQASLEKALAMNGQVTMGEGGPRLTVEVARPASDDTKRRERELAQVKNRTEEMERELRLREARVKELMREVQRKRERQQQVLSSARDLEVELKGELERQAKIRSAVQSLKEAEETLSSAFKAEEERTNALEVIMVSTCGRQRQQHADVAASSDAESHPQEPPADRSGKSRPSNEPAAKKERPKNSVTVVHEPETVEADSEAEDDETLGALQVRVKNTFLHFCVPHGGEEDAIPRTKTAPELTHAILAGEPGLTTMPGLMQLGPSPWLLKREASAAEVSRQLLEEKMSAQELPNTPSSGLLAHGGSSFQASGTLSPAANLQRASGCRRHVRLKNVPRLSETELEELLKEELARLWKAARGRPPPIIDEFRLAEQEVDRTIVAGIEAIVAFADPDDAAWLVDGRSPVSWSRLEVLSLRGRMLQVEWAAPLPVDWRRLRYEAETDASSQVSYATVGTRQSFSSHIGGRSGAARARAASPTTLAKRAGAACPARNRTVLLEGLPSAWPAQRVTEEVLALLQRLWLRDGLTFDVKEQLHLGGQGGIVVRPGRRAGEGNGGSCLVRLRSHLDAKWLVEGSTGHRLMVGSERPLRASWARPRQTILGAQRRTAA